MVNLSLFGRLLTFKLAFDLLTKLMAHDDVLGLADENESVRDAALGAGHVLVEHHATTCEFTLLFIFVFCAWLTRLFIDVPCSVD